MKTFLIIIALVLVGFLTYTYVGQEDPTVPEEATVEYSHDLIKVTSPQPEARVESPLMVSGDARGYWFFEANAPVVIVDWDGLIIGEGYIEATDEWMTEEFVPFTGEITFNTDEISGDYSDRGSIIFRKANPSDLPENDDAFEFPIYFTGE